MSFVYVATPFIAWLVTGVTKFCVNCIRERRLAFDLIGYGGFPSNHTAISSSVVFLVALREGIDHPVVGLGTAFVFIVMLDASSLRREVGRHAVKLNELSDAGLRERIGHTRVELAGGLVVGLLTALAMNFLALVV